MVRKEKKRKEKDTRMSRLVQPCGEGEGVR